MEETELERRRRILREGDAWDRLSILAYHLGDNVFGFDDEYQTTGERIGANVRGGIRRFVGDPIGTSYGALTGFADEVDQAMMGDADPIDYLMLASGAIGGTVGVPAARAVSRAGEDLIDAAADPLYRRQFENTLDEAGDPESYEFLGDAKFKDVYVPSDVEISMMESNPDIAQQIYLDKRRLASEMLDQGMSSKEIFEQTGIMHIPITSAEGGDFLGYRAVGFFDPNEGLVESLRPNRYANITETIEDLPPDIAGMAAPDTRTITYSRGLVPNPEDLRNTRAHELAHFDLIDADVDPREVGSSPSLEAEIKRNRISDYENAIAQETDRNRRMELRKILQEIKQRTPVENYYNNPGEMVARLAQGDYSTIRSMSPLEHLNPYFTSNQDLSLIARIDNAIRRSRGESVNNIMLPMNKAMSRVTHPNYVFKPK